MEENLSEDASQDHSLGKDNMEKNRILDGPINDQTKTKNDSTTDKADQSEDNNTESDDLESDSMENNVEPKVAENDSAKKMDVVIEVAMNESATKNDVIIEVVNNDSAMKNNAEAEAAKNGTATSLPSESSDSNLKEVTSNQDQSDEEPKPKDTKITCDAADRRSDRCQMDGDIRIHGKSGQVIFVTSSTEESRQVKPYARKLDTSAMDNVREVLIKPSNGQESLLCCDVNHSIPAVIFSSGGYLGNFFHDMSDVLVPLFQSTIQYDREVQFLMVDFKQWWQWKYSPVFKQLTKYDPIDLDNDDRVHCFTKATVGLDSDDDLIIDASRSVNGYSLVDFGRMIRTAFELPRENSIGIKKPRILFIARGRTRRLVNLDEIVKMAESEGYEVAVAEAEHNVTEFAKVVNSCDVMVGVHGAGLTNFVFLPMNAVVLQIVPLGNLDQYASNCYKKPPKAMEMRYLEYKISQEESTLSDMYPKDDPVFVDPDSVQKQGWAKMGEIYLVKQNVRIDIDRFRPVLAQAFKMLTGS